MIKGIPLLGSFFLILTVGFPDLKASPVPNSDVVEVLVEITEVDHSKASRLGIEWMEEITFSEDSPAGLMAIGSVERLTKLRANLHFFMQKGVAEILANPNLITDSGTTATFHAGGELPYITSTSLGGVHVEFKPYGVRLKIKPQLLKTGFIKMKIQAAISAPDEANGVVLSGNTVPALFEREVTSHVTVKAGTTVTLAGLVQSQKEETISGVPLLRRIPLVGALFRWQRHNYRRSTIVIFVTPRLLET